MANIAEVGTRTGPAACSRPSGFCSPAFPAPICSLPSPSPPRLDGAAGPNRRQRMQAPASAEHDIGHQQLGPKIESSPRSRAKLRELTQQMAALNRSSRRDRCWRRSRGGRRAGRAVSDRRRRHPRRPLLPPPPRPAEPSRVARREAAAGRRAASRAEARQGRPKAGRASRGRSRCRAAQARTKLTPAPKPSCHPSACRRSRRPPAEKTRSRQPTVPVASPASGQRTDANACGARQQTPAAPPAHRRRTPASTETAASIPSRLPPAANDGSTRYGIEIGTVAKQDGLRPVWKELLTNHAALVAGLQPSACSRLTRNGG